MAVTKGVNTWTTVAEADLYFAYRISASSWFSLTESGQQGTKSKESLLVTAFYYLKNKYNIPADTNNDYVRIAQCELALFFCDYYEHYMQASLLQAEGTYSLSAGKASQSFRKELELPEFVLVPLKTYLSENSTEIIGLEIK